MNCRGCLFLLAVAEIPDPDDPAHAAVRVIKDWTRSTFTELAAALVSDPDDASVLGDELALVVDGVYGSVQTRRDQERRGSPAVWRLGPASARPPVTSLRASRRAPRASRRG